MLGSIHIREGKQGIIVPKKPINMAMLLFDSFLLINQMAKKTRKSSRKSRRRTRRRIPKKGGSLLPLPSSPAIEVSTAGDNTDNSIFGV
jgi:hypothetical protein